MWLGYRVAVERESARNEIKLHELLDTIERTASIASFTNDFQLASEVEEGLLANRIVQKVAIYAGEELLAEAERSVRELASALVASHEAAPIVRPLFSPFDAKQVVGKISLVPDPVALAESASDASYFIAVSLFVQIFVVALAVLLVVYRQITRPLHRLADHLYRLPAEHGEKLTHARGHERDEIGDVVNYINHLIDRLLGLLHQERRLREAREIEELKYRSIFEQAATGIFLVDRHGGLISCNPACQELLQSESRLGHSGQVLAELLGKDEEAMLRALAACTKDRPLQREIRLRHGTEDRWLQLVLSQIDKQLYQGVINDITAHKRAAALALHASMTDPLTGLLNRRGFEAKLEQALSLKDRPLDGRLALIMVDLDLFKEVNDTHGHDAGDAVLRCVGGRLSTLVRRSDLVGRMGGDEFVVLVTAVDRPESLVSLARKIIRAVSQHCEIGGGRSVRVGASLGIALSQGGPDCRTQLLREADEAMYRAKRMSRNTFCFSRADPFLTSEDSASLELVS
ncbi:diguanylate cyclase [Thiorhodococcus minor]|uniref:Diguanylate cyclase n=1 Tax=Thiorhodococcus minor TaxID=57489 RepID=A0A6M0JX23_9GAMM|nr:diguanylate cyclase [Thiorhodococcus minor]NEV62092.1 diguanylate cyclase [Thiorhodococcus minor]